MRCCVRGGSRQFIKRNVQCLSCAKFTIVYSAKEMYRFAHVDWARMSGRPARCQRSLSVPIAENDWFTRREQASGYALPLTASVVIGAVSTVGVAIDMVGRGDARE